MDLTAVVCVLAFIIIVRFLSRSDPPKINGIYSQPNKWYLMKFMIFKFLLWLRKLEKNKKVTGENAGMGRKSRNSPEDMDKVQLLPKEHPKVNNFCIYL
jgi:hypothetical protein